MWCTGLDIAAVDVILNRFGKKVVPVLFAFLDRMLDVTVIFAVAGPGECLVSSCLRPSAEPFPSGIIMRAVKLHRLTAIEEEV